ncbi:MAG TPA: sialidase family protein [Methylophilaceae bacterium]|nr:sialidase family protein [Methylophilaceae bacterium]
MMKKCLLIIGLVISLFAVNVVAHEAHTINKTTKLAISVAFDQQGNLLRASVDDGFILVDKSSDKGKTFGAKVKVNQTQQNIAAKGEARPKIAIGPQGHIYLTWTQGLAKRFTGYVWFARSVDGGKTFEQPIIVHQDRAEITHRFDALHVASTGVITVSCVDKRDLEAAKAAGKAYTGAAIYYVTSKDAGASFTQEQKLADSSCECCRIAMTSKPDGTAVAMWRHVFEGGERDHMIAEIPASGKKANLNRATYGHWKIDGCPHHGAALASGGEGADWWGYHMAYFDGKGKSPGLYYSRMDGMAWAGSPPKIFGNPEKQARHPAILAIGKIVWLAWLETYENNIKKVMSIKSTDGGKTWSEVTEALNTNSQIDYPQLLQSKGEAYFAVNTNEGLILKSLMH